MVHVDRRKDMVVECANLRSKKIILNSLNFILKLKHWRVEVKSRGKKVIRLKSSDFLGIFRFRK